MTGSEPHLTGRAPAPWLLGLDNLLRIRRDQLSFFTGIRDLYGDAVPLRLGPYRSWVLFHPEHIKAVLVTHAASFVRFERVMRLLSRWNGQSVLIVEGAAWQQQRRRLLPGFRSSNLRRYADDVVARTVDMCGEWRRTLQPTGRQVIRTDDAMVELTLGLAISTMFGVEPDGELPALGRAVSILSDTAFGESLAPWSLPDWFPIRSKRDKRQAVTLLDRTVRWLIATRREADGGDPDDPLGVLLADERVPTALVHDEMVTLLIAGHETTGAALSWIFHLLASHPEACRTVQEQLDAVLGHRLPTVADLRALTALEGVMKEALRLYPPAYTLFLRRALADLDLGGVAIRAGDLVQIVPYCVQRDPRWFDQPDRFMPERFADEDSWPPYAYLPFGGGPRSCIGQSFGMMELGLVAATILRSFTPAPAAGPVTGRTKSSLRPADGLPLLWSARGGT